MNKKISIAIIAAAAIAAFFVFDLNELFTLENLQSQKDIWLARYDANPFLFIIGFFIIYVLATSLALPAAGLLTVAAGAFFGFWLGLLLVSFASSIGATFAFLITRYLLRDSIEKKFGNHLAKINAGIEKDGWLYVFGLRLVPLFPFFVVNALLALTKIKTLTYYIASQLGMLAGTAVFVNAGKQLSTIESLGDIISFNIIISFVLLAIFPFIAKYLMAFLNKNNNETGDAS